MDKAAFKRFIDDNMAAHPAERKIVRKVVAALKAAGKPVVAVWDGEEETPVKTLRDVQEQVFNLDFATLYTEDDSWVLIVMGNEWDALSDYTMDLEDILKPVTEYIDKNAD